MSIIEVTSRIGEIQATIAQVSGQAPAGASAPASAPGAAAQAAGILSGAAGLGGQSTTPGATAFNQALQSVLGTATPSAPQVAVPAPATPEKISAPDAPATVRLVKEPASRSDGVDGNAVVQASKKYLGVPYVWGGNNPAIGLDCSSFVQHTFRDLGINLPRVARQQAKEGTEVPSLAQAKPGDLIVTRGGGHIGIYLGDNKMIHAPRPGESVSIRELFETDKDIMTIRRIVPASTPDPTPAVSDAAAQRAAFENRAGA